MRLLLLFCVGLTAAAAEQDGQELLTVQAVREAQAHEQPAEQLIARFHLDPIQADALAVLPATELASIDDQGLRRMAAALLPIDDQARVRLASKRLSAEGGARLPMMTDKAASGSLFGGITFELERLKVTGDRLDVEVIPWKTERLLSSAYLQPSATGRVKIDTRGTAFTSCNFRGVVMPIDCRIELSQPPSDEVQLIQWTVTLHDPRPFAGLILMASGAWSPIEAQATQAIAVIEAGIDGGVLANPRLATLQLIGEAEDPAQITTQQSGQAITSTSRTIDLVFAPTGALARIDLGADTEVIGTPLPETEAQSKP